MAVAVEKETLRAKFARKHNIERWDAEDVEAWESGNKDIAKRNLIWSVVAEHVGFSVWSIWSVMVLFMPTDVYGIDAAGKFFLVAVPTLVGSILRIPYTVATARFGGRNWTIFSALVLLVPLVATLYLMLNPRILVHHVPAGRRDRRCRRRQLRLLDDEHQRVLPAAA